MNLLNEKPRRRRMLILLRNPKYPHTIYIQLRSCYKIYKIYDSIIKRWNKWRLSQDPFYYYNFYEFYDGSFMKFKREYLEIDDNVEQLGETYHKITDRYKKRLRKQGFKNIHVIKKQKN